MEKWEAEIRALCKDKFQSQLGSWLLQNAITEAQYAFKKFEIDKVTPIFGGKFNFDIIFIPFQNIDAIEQLKLQLENDQQLLQILNKNHMKNLLH